MSQYIEFYAKVGDKYAPVATRVHSSKIYECFRDVAPYGEVAPLTIDKLKRVKMTAHEEIEIYRGYVQKKTAALDWLRGAVLENSEKKFERYVELTDDIVELNEEIQLYENVLNFSDFLIDMIEHISYDPKVAEYLGVTADTYLYCGIECGNPGMPEDDF